MTANPKGVEPNQGDNVLVIIPALNEESTNSEVIQTLQDNGLYHIRVVDNGSCDRT